VTPEAQSPAEVQTVEAADSMPAEPPAASGAEGETPAAAPAGEEIAPAEVTLAEPANQGIAPETKAEAAQLGAKAVLAQGEPAMAGAVAFPKEGAVNLRDIMLIPALAIPIGLFLVFTIKQQQQNSLIKYNDQSRYR
jgi:hypothetical protein